MSLFAPVKTGMGVQTFGPEVEKQIQMYHDFLRKAITCGRRAFPIRMRKGIIGASILETIHS
jgi:hypothetical protein